MNETTRLTGICTTLSAIAYDVVVRRAHVEVDHTEHETHDQGFEQLTPSSGGSRNQMSFWRFTAHRAWDERQAELGFLLGAGQVGHALGLLEVLGALELVLVEAFADGLVGLLVDTRLAEQVLKSRTHGQVLSPPCRSSSRGRDPTSLQSRNRPGPHAAGTEAEALEVVQDLGFGAVVHHVAFVDHQDVVELFHHLRRRLQ
ncbi:hypothetical protein GQ600_27568 [Phytophthora cactorum]|nr:hypothetical protein GQ600_27568 [Phytophthora cactorum]